MTTVNRLVSILIILLNFYFVPYTIITIKNVENSMYYGLSILHISLLINLLLITALMVFKKKFNRSVLLLIINGLGLICGLFIFWLLITIPVLD